MKYLSVETKIIIHITLCVMEYFGYWQFFFSFI